MTLIHRVFKENKRTDIKKNFHANNCSVWCKKKCFSLDEKKNHMHLNEMERKHLGIIKNNKK